MGVVMIANRASHDLNNALSVIACYAELLEATFDEDDARRQDIAEILRAAARAAELARELFVLAAPPAVGEDERDVIAARRSGPAGGSAR